MRILELKEKRKKMAVDRRYFVIKFNRLCESGGTNDVAISLFTIKENKKCRNLNKKINLMPFGALNV